MNEFLKQLTKHEVVYYNIVDNFVYVTTNEEDYTFDRNEFIHMLCANTIIFGELNIMFVNTAK